MIRVIIIEDHAVVRFGLKQMLLHEPDMEVVGEFGDADAGLLALEQLSVDVVLMDHGLPTKSGLEALQEIATRHPAVPVLILSAQPESEMGLRALRAGASGYLQKTAEIHQLIHALREVARGGRYISDTLAEHLAGVAAEVARRPPHEALSEREMQIFLMLAGGHTVGDIAARLFLTPATVSTYRRRLLEKMQMNSNAELTRYALQHGLIG